MTQTSYCITKTPLRVSFFGGGTDFPSFYENADGGGCVLNMAIDKYVYVIVKKHGSLFDEHIRINYSETELVQNVCDIDNKIVRGCLQSSNIQESLYVNVVSDVPAGSGLGSSSGFCVGLLRALYAFKGEKRAAQELADEAAQIEINLLSSPIGLQDHYASAVGGINVFRFLKKEVTVLSRTAQFREIERYLMMFWTGICREANDILETQVEMVKARRTFDYLIEMRDQALEYGGSRKFNFAEFSRDLNLNWENKKKLAPNITTEEIDNLLSKGLQAGALGGKLCGAGGGGFLMFMVPCERRSSVRGALSNLLEVPMGLETSGAQLLYPHA